MQFLIKCSLLGLLLSACNSIQMQDTDPGGELNFINAAIHEDQLYTGVIFYPEKNRAGSEGLARFDAKRLFINQEELQKANGEHANPNYSFWDLQMRFKTISNGMGVGFDLISQKWIIFDLTGQHNPNIMKYQADPIGTHDIASEVTNLNQSEFLTASMNSQGQQEIVIYQVSSEKDLEVVARFNDQDCYSYSFKQDYFYCAKIDSSQENLTLVRSYFINRQTKSFELISEETISSIGNAITHIALLGDKLAVFSQGAQQHAALFNIENGVPSFDSYLEVPGVKTVFQTQKISETRSVLFTNAGSKLIDTSFMNATALVLDTYSGAPGKSYLYDSAEQMYLGVYGRNGIELMQIKDDKFAVIGGYARKFGDQLFSYGKLNEFKY